MEEEAHEGGLTSAGKGKWCPQFGQLHKVHSFLAQIATTLHTLPIQLPPSLHPLYIQLSPPTEKASIVPWHLPSDGTRRSRRSSTTTTPSSPTRAS